MSDQPASFESAAETADRVRRIRETRGREAAAVENVSLFGRFEIPRRAMRPQEAAAAFAVAAELLRLER
jgi:hypothetical protein